MTIRKTQVADVMTTRPTVLSADASLAEADIVLRSTIITGLPVVDRDGVLVGVITHAHLTAYRFADSRRPGASTTLGSTSAPK
jgi:CBS domain-containing protein